jgi:hypothetical protein
MRRAAIPIALAAAILVIACQSGSLSTPIPTAAPSVVYQITPAGPRPSKDVTERAIGVFEARLRALGIGTFSGGAGDAITFDLPAPVNDAQIRAVLSMPGKISFVPLGPPGTVQAVEGQALPGNPAPLFEGDQVAGASLVTDATSGPTAAIRFTDAAAKLFAAYTSTHIGDQFAIVLDGRIVVMPIVMSTIPDGAGNISLSAQHQAIPIEVLVAILAAGPLPPAWIHAAVRRL